MPVDPAATYTSLYNRAATDSAGSALRALLGSFPTTFPADTAFANKKAVFPADRLGLFAGKGVTLPWLAWKERGVAGPSGGMRDVGGAWWVYAAPSAGSRALYLVAAALDALYGSAQTYALNGGRLGVTFIGQPFDDSKLGLAGLEVRIGFRRLG
jgi:hypothetical protein